MTARTPADGMPHTGDTHDAGFAARVRSAFVWRWGAQVAAQIITWTSTFLVVRLLDPADYGLFAMSQVVVTTLAFLNGQSFATSIVQTDRIDDRRVGQVFGMLIIANVLLAAIQFVFAPYAAAYFKEPVVADLLRVQAAIFLTIPFIAMPSEWLARGLEFRKQAKANMGSALVGAFTALILAWAGWGVWALIYAGLSIFVSRACFLMIAARFWITPVFTPKGAWDLFSYGGVLTLCQLFWIIQSQSDVVIAGRLLETYDLGLYTQALFLALVVTGRFIPPINEVALAAYSELHRAKKPLGPYFLKTARLVMMVCAPIYIGLALTAEQVIPVLMGEKWLSLIPIFAGLTVAMPAFALHLICSPVTNAMGRPKVYLFTSIAGAVIFPAMFLWQIGGEGSHGAMGLVDAWGYAAPLLCLITLTVTLPRIGVTPFELGRALTPIIIACGAMTVAVLGVERFVPIDSPFFALVRSSLIGAGVYAATFWFGYRSIVRETWALIRNRGPHESQTTLI
ncbi:lipopolysaccharide biosynthesis protein [Erythrobacter sp. SCSIO 43205]|uniref:lipopolysaccharide biosynthesis protein n=1 Tax=Erythrobacter sp. SCSIO 43205 TaxID=2779361 RepID=UPI001CA954F8|nr:lipopolysaccharide biosynthesis protein [Erythrobacter sp. SCSIO 43205]UAB78890.1 lipopolysaccharide biosynthesis protein [Erythrobacter sp. SCSIO 43205]